MERYIIHPDRRECRIFFMKSKEERQNLFNHVRFVTEINGFSYDGKAPLHEDFMEAARAQNEKTLIVSAGNETALDQVKAAQKEGFRICFGTAEEIHAVIRALLRQPDFIVLKDLDEARLREVLLAETAVEPYWTPMEDSDAEQNYLSAKERTGGTELRIMSYNILNQDWNHQPRIRFRAQGVADVIHHFAPDFAGIQEVSALWYQELEEKLKPYVFVKQHDPAWQGNLTPNLIYDSRKYRQVDGGLLPYTGLWLRSFHWAMLESLESGKRCIITNTHWDLTPETRMMNSGLMRHYLIELRGRYPDIPILCTGDFNSGIHFEEFKYLLDSGVVQDSVMEAPVRENEDISSCYDMVFSSVPFRKAGHIDHVLFTPELEVLSARLIWKKELLTFSDHLPLIADLKFR